MPRVVGAGLLASAFAPLVALLAVLKLSELGWVSCVILATSLTSILRALWSATPVGHL